MKLLLVEDRKSLSDILAKGLRKCSYAVDTAYDGEQAIELYDINPFDFKELEARIRCLLRQEIIQHNIIIERKSLKIDISKKYAYYNDKILNLTKKEYSILEFLLMNKGHSISSEELIEHVWESDTDLFSNSLKTHVYSLKKKIADYTDENIIKNNRKQGYIIE